MKLFALRTPPHKFVSRIFKGPLTVRIMKSVKWCAKPLDNPFFRARTATHDLRAVISFSFSPTRWARSDTPPAGGAPRAPRPAARGSSASLDHHVRKRNSKKHQTHYKTTKKKCKTKHFHHKLIEIIEGQKTVIFKPIIPYHRFWRWRLRVEFDYFAFVF